MIIKLTDHHGISVEYVLESQMSEASFAWLKPMFSAKDTEVFPSFAKEEKKIFVGLGKKENLTAETLRRQSFQLGKILEKYHIKKATIDVPDFKAWTNNRELCAIKAVRYLVEGLLQSSYRFDPYLSDKKEDDETVISLKVRPGYEEKAAFSIEETTNIMSGVFFTRDLVNTPPIDLYPETLAEKAKETLEKSDVKVTIYGKKQIEELGMKAFLAVSQGSDKEPQLIVMEYLPNENEKPIALVGKGLTYDSGGYAIKTPKGMVDMKSDMGGAATVIGTISALARNKVKKNVIGIICACENMISGKAYKNGDIISSMKGLSIEVRNTDAEGRITLADALYYAATKTDCEMIIDLATLTGASIVAVGEFTTALISNDDHLVKYAQTAAEKSGEYVWELKANEQLRELVKGTISDLKNSTESPFGGCITAGIFLEHFIENKPWLHMDIAGSSFSGKPYSYLPKDATGVPVKTLYQMILDFTDKQNVFLEK